LAAHSGIETYIVELNTNAIPADDPTLLPIIASTNTEIEFLVQLIAPAGGCFRIADATFSASCFSIPLAARALPIAAGLLLRIRSRE
jgi:hypothetical protein